MSRDETEGRRIKEDGTLASCVGAGKPTLPNLCDTCKTHSDLTCRDLRDLRRVGNDVSK